MVRPYNRKTPKVAQAPQGPTFDGRPDAVDDSALDADDAALGIGEGEEALAPAFEPAPSVGAGAPQTISGVDVATLLANPDFARMVDAIVTSRLGAQAGAAPSPAPSSLGSSPEFREFMLRLERQFDAMQEQKPGYIKPWTADEMAARARGLADLKAILADYRARNVWPTYLLGEDFYGQSQNGLKIHKAGKKIRTLVFPAESFVPMDEYAARVYEAYKRWVGEVHEIGDLIASAMAIARGADGPAPPELTAGKPMLAQSDVIELEDEAVDVSPARTLGTLVPEPRVVGQRPASGGAPVGPEFTEYV
jgi:hypothetical protein